MENYTIYKFTFSDGKTYIGQTREKVEDRWKNGEGYRGQEVYVPIILQGWHNIKKEILHTNLTAEQADSLEKYYIKKFNSKNAGYNRTDGGGSKKVFKVNNDQLVKQTDQFAVTLERKHVDTSGNNGSWTPYYDRYFNKAFSRLKTRGAIAVYCYLTQQIPHYKDGKRFSGRKGDKPFYFSPAAVEKEMGIDKRTVQAGWKELIKIGYLVEQRPNKFYFNDILKEDLINNNYVDNEEECDNNILTLEEIQNTIPIYFSNQNNNEDKRKDKELQQIPKICDWMTEEEKEAILSDQINK